MKIKCLVLAGIIVLVVASGCASVQKMDGTSEVLHASESENTQIVAESVEPDVTDEETLEEISEEEVTEEQVSEEASEEECSEEDLQEDLDTEGVLTEEELDTFSKWASSVDTYGFLLSTYSDITDADLNQVFYVGAGIDSPMTDEDFDEYIAISAYGSVETDITKIYAKDIDDFLLKKTGYSLQEMQHFDFEYSQNYDCYYHQHGDTNGVSFTCLEGEWQGDLLVLKFSMGSDSDMVSAITTVEKNGDTYRIVSNEYTGW